MRICCTSIVAWLVLPWLVPSYAAAHRRLGGFDELNELVKDAVVRLPDATVSADSITLDLSNLRCTNFSIDDLRLVADQNDGGTIAVQVDIEGLDMICYLDYVYEFLFTRQGSADLYSYGNRASVTMSFESQNDNIFSSSVETCDPQVNVDNLDFHGGILAIVLDVVEGLVRNKVENQVELKICEELQALSTTFLSDLLQRIDETLAQYKTAEVQDALQSENALPKNIALLDFQNQRTATGKWLNRMLEDAVAFVSKPADDGSDLNANVLLREHVLEDGAFFVDVGDLQLFQGHDQLTQTTIVLESVKVFGLDTLTTFEPLVDIGKHTIQNELSWASLTIELDVTIDIKPSTLEDSVILNPVSRSVVEERVKIKFSVEDVNAVASILLAVDEEKLGSLRLGSLLNTDLLLPCFLSTLFALEISALSVEVGDVQPPTLQGFVSPGIDRVVSSSVDAAFLMYEDALLEAAPGFFQIAVREYLNRNVVNKFLAEEDGGECSSPLDISASKNGFIDFRDLLLSPDLALAAGGLGTQPYGDVVSTVVSNVQNAVSRERRRWLAESQFAYSVIPVRILQCDGCGCVCGRPAQYEFECRSSRAPSQHWSGNIRSSFREFGQLWGAPRIPATYRGRSKRIEQQCVYRGQVKTTALHSEIGGIRFR